MTDGAGKETPPPWILCVAQGLFVPMVLRIPLWRACSGANVAKFNQFPAPLILRDLKATASKFRITTTQPAHRAFTKSSGLNLTCLAELRVRRICGWNYR